MLVVHAWHADGVIKAVSGVVSSIAQNLLSLDSIADFSKYMFNSNADICLCYRFPVPRSINNKTNTFLYNTILLCQHLQ